MKTSDERELDELNDAVVASVYRARFEPSKLDSRYTCAVCSKDAPSAIRGKAYKWDEESICIGSFDRSEHPERRISHYFKNPTTDPAAAFEVLKACAERLPMNIEISHNGPYWFISRPDEDSGVAVMESTLELAIAKFSRKLFSKSLHQKRGEGE